MRIVLLLPVSILALGLVGVALGIGMPRASTRTYWPTSVHTLATGQAKHTHAAVRGRVIRAYLEDDGDRHIWIRDSILPDSVVFECVPLLPCTVPPIGALVTGLGITRRDPEHGWYELHPLERWGP